jgi:ABC-type Fe3+-siderophore transport system permease subunit
MANFLIGLALGVALTLLVVCFLNPFHDGGAS